MKQLCLQTLALPLSDEQRLDGLTRVIEQKSTRLGRELSDCMQRHHAKKSTRQQAQVVLDEKWLVYTTKEGSLTTALMEGYLFKIWPKNLNQLFPPPSTYSLI